ncbi:MAG: ABC transporter permease [Burkholderiales bacterium]|nr:ABC transporter permease [Anaerolineae bacterium]
MSSAALSPVQAEIVRPSRNRRLLRRVLRTGNITFGASALLIITALAIFAPVISPYDPLAVIAADRLQPPSILHLFGTDDFGRDVLTRVLYGAQLSLQVGLISVALASFTGSALGVLAGYYGGRIDAVIMRFIDVLLAFPSILLALAIVAILGRSLPNVMLAVGISTIPLYTRVVRASTLSIKQVDFILAARAIGCPSWRIMTNHILPNVIAPIIVVTTNGIAGAIIAGAALGFLGLGAVSPTPEWGLMLSEGRAYLRAASWVTTFPGLAIMVTVMAINLLGDGLRDVFDPRLRI